ncbi:MAG TPA: hypothetical protein VD947_03620 [Patescibacteria group bacterium]|nr:hypothetical protein [Patescibacteria group bacterium]
MISYNMLMPPKDDDPKWAYTPESNAEQSADSSSAAPAVSQDQKPLTWTASEFIYKHKGGGWYLLFFIGLIIATGLVFLITKDYMSSIFIAIAGAIFVIVIPKKPRELAYEVNNQGVRIGNRSYSYAEFKSFDLVLDGGVKCINLIPLKRLMPEISLYFPPEQEMAIVYVLAQHLPHDQYQEKSIDRLIRRLHF